MTEEESNDTDKTESEDTTYVSGLDLLKTEFVDEPNSSADDTSDDSDEGDEKPQADESDDSSPKELDVLDDETIRRVLAQPNVQTALRSVAATQEANLRAELAQEVQTDRQKDEELLLSDEELGQRKRQQEAMAEPLNNAKQEGYNAAQQDFMNLGIGDIWNQVEELKSLPEADRQSLDPRSSQFKSMGEYVSALVDTAATIRADKLVQEKAQKLADTMVQEEMREFREKQPNPEGVSGPTSPPNRDIDYENATGLDLLKKAFNA